MRRLKTKKTKVFLLTEEELEKFDHMITALMQAYWALMTQRSVAVPQIRKDNVARPEEEKFYQLHFELNEQIDSTDV